MVDEHRVTRHGNRTLQGLLNTPPSGHPKTNHGNWEYRRNDDDGAGDDGPVEPVELVDPSRDWHKPVHRWSDPVHSPFAIPLPSDLHNAAFSSIASIHHSIRSSDPR
jgi:hypothetical protein